MDNKYDCELIKKGECTGCTGLAEKDWIGKYSCKYYKEYKKKLRKIQIIYKERSEQNGVKTKDI